MRIDRLTVTLLLSVVLSLAPAFAQATAAGTAKTEAAKTEPAKKPVAATVKKAKLKGGPTQNATAADIANAKTNGLVWVNTSTGVYHKDGEYFGATKQGKFMTEAEAQKGHFRSAKDGGAVAAKKPKPFAAVK